MLNAPSVVVLLVVGVLLVLAVRSIARSGKGGSCAGCSAKDCAASGQGGPCPAALDAMAQVEAQLDQGCNDRSA